MRKFLVECPDDSLLANCLEWAIDHRADDKGCIGCPSYDICEVAEKEYGGTIWSPFLPDRPKETFVMEVVNDE